MSEDNKAFYSRMTEKVWNNGDSNGNAIEEFYAPDVVIHSAAPGWPTGIDGVRATVSMIKGGISGFELGIQFMLADGDKVAAKWTIRGTHSGELMGVPATGKPINFQGVSVVRIEDDKIVDIWGASDGLGLMQQLGAFPY
jgi:steroid delta-isomerase-like uncharacterized protein